VITDTILIFVIRAFQAFLRSIPERSSCFIGVGLGRISYHCLGVRRRVAIDNAGRIDSSLSLHDRRAVAKKCFENLGVNFVEVLLFPFLSKDEVKRRFSLESRPGVDEILATGKGVLILGFHFSNWEIMGVASLLLHREIVALARPLKDRLKLNEFLIGLRQATGLTIIPNKDTARDVIRLVREGRMIAFLGDQREKRSKAVWVELFGQKVPTSKGIVALAMKTGAPVIPVYSERMGFLNYKIICDTPLFMEKSGAPKDELIYSNTRKVNMVLERIVAQSPDEWFLVHRRFGRDT
jgi:Kdo2-lipid IVA lauroyltransferase/acyltransferase